jgi:hypothetical protein
MAREQESVFNQGAKRAELEIEALDFGVQPNILPDQTKKVLDEIDQLIGIQVPLAVRHPVIPDNILGIRWLSPDAFGDDQTLREEALQLETYRGKKGFSAETIRSVFGEDGRLSLDALKLVVENYKIWNGGKIPTPPRLR